MISQTSNQKTNNQSYLTYQPPKKKPKTSKNNNQSLTQPINRGQKRTYLQTNDNTTNIIPNQLHMCFFIFLFFVLKHTFKYFWIQFFQENAKIIKKQK